MSQNRKQDLRTFPASSGFVRAAPPRYSFDPLRDRALEAYRKQQNAVPEGTASSPPPARNEAPAEGDQINLEDLLDSGRKAA